MNPLKQGLKRQTTLLLHHLWLVKVVNPLKQGLKPEEEAEYMNESLRLLK